MFCSLCFKAVLFLLQGMFFYTLVKYEAPKYGDMEYPSAAIGIAWLYGISSSLPILVYPLYLLFIKTRGEPLGLWQVSLKCVLFKSY